jgi:hypothetical protein
VHVALDDPQGVIPVTHRWTTGTVFAFVLSCLTHTAEAERLESLRVLQEDYPQVYFFRQYNRTDRPYEEWEKSAERMMGFGAGLRQHEFATRFKRRHPNQLVLYYRSGNACLALSRKRR